MIRSLVDSKGEELFNRMISDRLNSEAGDPEAPVYGKMYYANLRDELMPTSSPLSSRIPFILLPSSSLPSTVLPLSFLSCNTTQTQTISCKSNKRLG